MQYKTKNDKQQVLDPCVTCYYMLSYVIIILLLILYVGIFDSF